MTHIDLSSMQPGDAAAALRSFPRRFRDAAHDPVAEEDPYPEESEVDEIATRPGPDGWSVADVVAAAASRLEEARDAVSRGLVHDGATVPSTLGTPTATITPGAGRDLPAELDRLDAVADAFAATVHDARAERWNSTVSIDGGGSTTLLRVLQMGISPVVSWLREVEPLVRAVRGRPRG